MTRSQTLPLTVALLLPLLVAPVQAEWIPTGFPVCGETCRAGAQIVVPDGVGGVYIGWRDSRDYPSTGDDVYAQKLTASGEIAPGWPAAGLPVCLIETNQTIFSTASDGEGGVLIVWGDFRNSGSGSLGQDLYMQRVLADGQIAPGWAVNGMPVVSWHEYQSLAQVTSDGTGGAFVAWHDWRDHLTQDVDVYAQHLTATGTVAPGWPAAGLPVSTAPGFQSSPKVLPDGLGGVVIVWEDGRTDLDTYALRLHGDGTLAPGWSPNGNLIASGKAKVQVALDGAGGFYVASATPLSFIDGEYYVQRIRFSGEREPGWPEEGVLVCTAPGFREGMRAAPDGLGGVLMTWYDDRLGGYEVFASRILPDGALAPGWTPNGVVVSDPTLPGNALAPNVVRDGFGGAYVAWEWQTGATRSYVQHLTASGAVAPGWIFGGIHVAPNISQFKPVLSPDGAGGAIAVWEERNSTENRFGLYAQRFLIDGPVPVQLSLVSSEVTAERVSLTWHVADGSIPSAAVYRRAGSASWRWVATIESDGSGTLRYEDLDVEPATSYGYRLGWAEDGREQLSTETWVEIPSAFTLQLAGFTPNPSTGPVTVSFTLPSTAPATLELLDVTGRRVVTRDVGSLGPGQHLVRLDDGVARLSPGMYFVRLSTGAQQLISRGAIVR